MTCLCGHTRELHVNGTGECQKTVPKACACRGWMRAVENVGTTADLVNAPAHYNWIPGGVQPIDIAEHLPFNLGAALKYIVRAGRKGDAIEDLRKAAWHINRELQRLGAKK